MSSFQFQFLRVLAALTLGTGLAQAQSLAQPPASALRNFQTPVPLQVPSVPLVPRTRAVTEEAKAPLFESTRSLRLLANNLQGLRMMGEIGSSEWPLYVTDSQAQRQLKIQIGFLSSISVMPEASNLTVYFNDRPLGTTPIAAPNAVKTITFDIPRDLVRPGFNALRIGVNQRHRVDCSLGATYELWTQIDPAQTGLVIDGGDATISDIVDLPALNPSPQGMMPIRAIIPPKAALGTIDQVLRTVQTIALNGRFEQPRIDYGPLVDDPYGLNLAIGTIEELRKLMGRIDLGPVTGPRVFLMNTNAGRRPLLVLTGVTPAEVEQAVQKLAVIDKRRGTELGLRAAGAFPGYRLQSEQKYRLRDLGLNSEGFAGHYFRKSFNVVMPTDFYPADYGKMVLRLDGAYKPGLTTDAQILIAVNERKAASAPLPKSDGDSLDKMEIKVPLGFLKPGLNRIEIQGLLPMQSDLTCDPLQAINAKNRFLLLDTSELEVPQIARIARSPELSLLTSGAFPLGVNNAPVQLYVPGPDRDTMGAATSLMARLAIAAGQPLDVHMAITPPNRDAGAAIIIASAKALSNDIADKMSIDLDGMRTAWREAMSVPATSQEELRKFKPNSASRNRVLLQQNRSAACTPEVNLRNLVMRQASFSPSLAAQPAELTVNSPPLDQDVKSKRVVDEWSQEDKPSTNYFSSVSRGYQRVRQIVRQIPLPAFPSFGSSAAPHDAPAEVTASTSLILAQANLGNSAQDIWTLVTAPTSSALAEGIGCLLDYRIWQQVGGRMSLIEPGEAKVSTIEAEATQLVATQSPSIHNYRLIVAGWFSLNQGAYVFAALLMSVLLGIVTVWQIRCSGRRQDP